MFDDLDGDDLYAELIMLRSNDLRAFIVLEGPTDCHVLDEFVNDEHFTTVPALGKDRALGAIARLDEGTVLDVFALLDRDWVGILEEGVKRSEVAYTDFYDMDACIFFTPGVYEKLAATFCTDHTFKRGAPGCSHHDISTACVDLALAVGVLRFISSREGLGLALRKFPLDQVANVHNGSIDLGKLITIACRKADKNPDDYPSLLDTLQRELAAIKEPRRYCSGHDLAKAFHLVAKRRWATKIGADVIERSARAAYGRDHFEQGGIYRSTNHWTTISGETAWRLASAAG
ncbi:hypothetical protein [Streptacidiphilus carbonis]|uniref:hypothetical protein n=1 Tax=Streptacidiphilus carbonis TaxID=105422 RepID=UPI0005AB1211|nr:hypothetical protein [Streptacidiphilus carbonis]